MEGHREYVGGDFERIGLWQFNTLKDIADIQPSTTLLDIACGSLRLGKHLIPFLDEGKYYGLEAYDRMLNEGIDKELKNDLTKRPSFAINSTFDFNFCPGYDVAWANSLFSHLIKEDIAQCFINLKTITSKQSTFFFTYFQENNQKKEKQNPTESHARKDFYYKESTIHEIANDAGWQIEKVKAIHPRSQTIMKGIIHES